MVLQLISLLFILGAFIPLVDAHPHHEEVVEQTFIEDHHEH